MVDFVGRYGVVLASWLDMEEIGVNEIAVLAVLATHADKEGGQCYPSQATIARKLKRSRPLVNATIKKLVEIGLVKKENRQRKNGGETSALYRLCYDRVPEKRRGAEAGHASAENEAAESGVSLTGSVHRWSESTALELSTPERASHTPEGTGDRATHRERAPSGPPDIRQTLPEDWQPRPEDLDWARKTLPHIDAVQEAVRFHLVARAQGWRYADSSAAFKAWLLREAARITENVEDSTPDKKKEDHAENRRSHSQRQHKSAGPLRDRPRRGAPTPGAGGERNGEVLCQILERFALRRGA